MRPRASFPSIDKLRSQKANKLCVSLGLGQFLDRIAVQEQDRKLEPFSVSRQQLLRLLTLVVNARCVRFCTSVARGDCVSLFVGPRVGGRGRCFRQLLLWWTSALLNTDRSRLTEQHGAPDGPARSLGPVL